MNPQTEKLLIELASKFGTTAEHLWSVMVKQAVIESSIDLTIIAGFYSLPAVLIVAACRKRDSVVKSCERLGVDIDHPLVIITAACWAFFALLFLTVIPSAVTGIINPEYWALKQLLP